MKSYQNPPSFDEDEIVVPLSTTITPATTTTTTVRSLGMIVVVASMIMLVVGGSVWMYETKDGDLTTTGRTTTAAEGLVVGTQGHASYAPAGECLPADGTFIGISNTTYWGNYGAFETCYQLGDSPTYCWSKSYQASGGGRDHPIGRFYQCIPDGLYEDDAWHSIDGKIVGRCGAPCQKVHRKENY